TNDTPEALAALERWEQEVGCHIDPSQKPEGATAMRGALVHEFKTRTQVLVATEAGAKGLNLQFCNCLVNFDLPWNPQRVEQRIGRVHRYGQKHDVVIVNFINLDNEGEQRVYELLKEKLGLFEGLFGASDEILGRMVSVLDFESRVVELLSACRSPEEQQREFDRLALELDDETRKAHDERLRHAESLIASLDDDVKERLRLSADALPVALSRRDETVIEILNAQSDVRRLGVDGDRLLLEWSGRRFHLGPPEPGERCGEPLNLDHPMMQSILRRCRQRTDGQSFICSGPVTGRWSVYRVEVVGVEEEERILVVGTTGLAGLREVLAQAAELRVEENADSEEQGLPLALARLREEAEREQGPRLDRALNQLEARKQDVRRVLEYREEKLRADLAEADKKRRLARSSEDSRKALAKHRKVQVELDALMRERDGQIREASRRLSSRQQELRSRRYVEATPTLLFRLRCEGQR
ncbi:MAG: hypothetical protein KC910_32200, partial [Candidatus Eremiobacteraeota bacterium]|nr:hypothetical protein [Candidatus Eremiobacteraeota bacterium]